MTDPTSDEVAELTAAAKGNRMAAERLAATIREAFRPFRWLLAAILALMVGMIVGGVFIYKIVDDSQQTRMANREILLEIRSFSDPNSPRSQQSAARTQELVQQLVDRFSEVVERGTIDATRATLEIRRCAFGDLAEFEDCIRDHLPADVFIPEDAESDVDAD